MRRTIEPREESPLGLRDLCTRTGLQYDRQPAMRPTRGIRICILMRLILLREQAKGILSTIMRNREKQELPRVSPYIYEKTHI